MPISSNTHRFALLLLLTRQLECWFFYMNSIEFATETRMITRVLTNQKCGWKARAEPIMLMSGGLLLKSDATKHVQNRQTRLVFIQSDTDCFSADPDTWLQPTHHLHNGEEFSHTFVPSFCAIRSSLFFIWAWELRSATGFVPFPSACFGLA